MTKIEQEAYDAMFDSREQWMARALRAEEATQRLSERLERYEERLAEAAANGAIVERMRHVLRQPPIPQ
jgi:hypothetical protein